MQRQHVERFVEQHVALVEVDAEGVVLGLEVAGADTEDEAAVGQLVDSGGGLRQQGRIAVGEHGQVRQQLQLGRDGGDVRQGDERVEALVAARFEPLGARGRVFGEREAVPAGSLRSDGEIGDRSCVEHVAVDAVEVGVLEDEPHR